MGNQSAQTSVSAQLSVRRGREAIEFYKAAFGAVEIYRVGGIEGHEEVVAQLSVGNASFWVADESPPHKNFSPESLGGSTARLLLVVQDPHSVVERAVALGGTEVSPVEEEHGWLLGRIEDPFGHNWEIGKPLVEWPPSHAHQRPHTRSGAWRLPHRVRVSGGEVATDVFGEGSPVVLVHGTPAWSYLWREVAPSVALRHTVHVWDLLGFGDSRVDPGVAPSIAQQAGTLAELIEHWGLDTPSLVGHDIGGGIVLRAHLIHDVPVRRIALLDAAVIGPWNTPFTEHMQRHADTYRTMPSHVFGDIIGPRLRTATHHQMSDAVLRAYLAPWAGPAGQQRWVDQVAAVSFEDTREVVARLDRITAPTLVLWGEQDQWLDPSMGDRLAAAIPGAHLTIVTGAGHFLPEDNPQDTADALLRFLD